MKLNSVAASEGYVWIRQGIWLFKQNPLGFIALVFMYVFLAQLAILIPLAGVLVVLILTPALSVGFMTACRQAIQRERIVPTVYLVALRSPTSNEVRNRILQLGLIYSVLILILSLIASMVVDFQALIPLLTNDKNMSSVATAHAMSQLYSAVLVGGLIYVPIAMVMWFAPVLIAWENMPIGKALFASWMACWTNKGAFIIYMSIWSLFLIALPLGLGILFDAMGLGEYVSFAIAPLSMAGLTVMYCSFFATWKSCFTDNDAEVRDS